ncbi:MAG: Cytochrome c1 [Rhodocyclaceae bacterium]|nr:Cytochrome c1 [Rhodocyclaceae bacterium]
MKKFLMALLFAPLTALASGAALHLDKWPGSVSDKAALQNGAKLFVNYCLNCHGASYMRYNKLMDLGLTEQEVKDNLMFTAEKIGEQMRVAARTDEQKQWFGAAPPDLSVISRARASEAGSGADWLYTYLRSFYRDDKRPTGWNNVVFENVGMPHILYGLQGQQVLNHETHKLELAVPGTMQPAEFDKAVSDLVGYLVWMAEPGQEFRKTLGVGVLIFLALLFVLAYALKKEYWKDVH